MVSAISCGDDLRRPVGVLPAEVGEVLVEGAQDVGEPVYFGLGGWPAADGGTGPISASFRCSGPGK